MLHTHTAAQSPWSRRNIVQSWPYDAPSAVTDPGEMRLLSSTLQSQHLQSNLLTLHLHFLITTEETIIHTLVLIILQFKHLHILSTRDSFLRGKVQEKGKSRPDTNVYVNLEKKYQMT